MDKKVNEEKKRERIISQKNEQIRKISQEAEKTRQELNMVKTGNNKEFDQQKKPKKSRSTSKKRNREAIIEIPILPEIPSDDRKNEKARDLFFYDIPKYWNQEEILAQLTILGRAMEEAVEDSCTLGNTSRIWLIRNKKTLYKDEKKSGKDKIEITVKGNEKKEKVQPEMTTKKGSEETRSSERLIPEVLPMTPEARMYAELGNFASKNHEFFKDAHPRYGREQQITFREHSPEKQKTRSPEDQKVVDMIKRWRIVEDEEYEALLEKERQKEALKKDNVAPEE
ncbi:hypothetical protein RhiirA4_521630, partial [Rhizophagus irregularis]